MNKKIIFAAVGAVSLVGGIIAGIIHRSNKRYREAVEELDRVYEILDKTTEMLDETIDYMEELNSLCDELDDEEDDEEDE